ncbi:centrosomal protein of 83 kDa-like [Erpetoichthys calabaricus]|uniref:centrosomal protein of 83 kDa-like n=1 Tax=Erpetoichthys calabaricus TaxID=27687 RepID=UPI0022342DF6|nr:centrosomal protein of 83 kDa-like [Erpetoichthys calabaricus]
MLKNEKNSTMKQQAKCQPLNTEHAILKDEFLNKPKEGKCTTENKAINHKLLSFLAQLREELLTKSKEVEELKLQVLTPPKLELLRAQIQQEQEGPIRHKFNQLDEDIEKYREEYNKLRYEHAFLKSEFEHQVEAHNHILEENKIFYEAEIARLEKEKEDLNAQLLNNDPVKERNKMESVLNENAQLLQRIKCLESEILALRAEKDSCGAKAENAQRMHMRQVAESQATVESLKAEKHSLKLQVDCLEKKLHLCHEQNSQLIIKLHRSKRDVGSLNDKIKELRHSYNYELANIKLDCARAKGEIERERDNLHSEMQALRSTNEVMKSTINRLNEHVAQLEKELEERLQITKLGDFQKLTKIHEEKLELESMVADLEEQKAAYEAFRRAEQKQWEDKLRVLQISDESSKKEIQILKSKLHNQGHQIKYPNKVNNEKVDMKQQNYELQIQLDTLQHRLNEFSRLILAPRLTSSGENCSDNAIVNSLEREIDLTCAKKVDTEQLHLQINGGSKCN